ncbi:MAG: phosphate transport system regulator PhoU [Methylococcaceae bacterium]|nr:phosphate transport system regulator PhoU [Methylococcaceae bacterium]
MDNSKIGHHISEQFNLELEDIRNKVLTMGGLVEQQIELAIQAFATGDAELAELVIKQDNQVDALEMAIDLECTQILAAERIAKMAIQLSDTETKKDQYHELQHMTDLVKEMLHGALDAFARMCIDDITEITGRDDSVDREYASIIRQLITHMMEDPRNITRTLNVLWTVRAVERIGDHACYICEHLIFMIKGEAVRHLTQSELEKKLSE